MMLFFLLLFFSRIFFSVFFFFFFTVFSFTQAACWIVFSLLDFELLKRAFFSRVKNRYAW